MDKILSELYRLDPSLRAREGELVKLLAAMLRRSPSLTINQAFVSQLKRQLESRARELPVPASSAPAILWHPWLTAGVGIVVILLVTAVPLLWQEGSKPVKFSSAVTISNLEQQAFGSLSGQSGDAQSLSKTMNVGSPEMAGQGADSATGVSAPVMSAPSVGFGGGGAAAGSAGFTDKMIVPPGYPEVVNYNFTYVGDEFTLAASPLAVLRRVKGSALAAQLAASVYNLNFDLMNFRSLNNLEVANLGFNEDKDFGYSVNISPLEGVVSINKNWAKWPNPWQNCQTDDCYQQYRFKATDLPADDAIITVADQFLADKGIDRTIYAEPTVNNDWRVYYDMLTAAEKINYYFPDTLQVLYPLQLNDQPVYESSQRFGLLVTVDLREMRVSDVYNLQTQQYESSDYPVLTDTAAIIKQAKQGGYQSYYPVYFKDNSVKEVTVSLGTPVRGYLKIWQYRPDKQYGDELFVPALFFPVLNQTELKNFYTTQVIVPLIEEFSQDQGGPIRIMPWGEPTEAEPAVPGDDVPVGNQ
ncbi:hypothetical protein HY933_01590 [Candidatus Falkowbacteria bacterium]|nr:hypothetical protein [Candidatus Falkowbacteria bacterium]